MFFSHLLKSAILFNERCINPPLLQLSLILCTVTYGVTIAIVHHRMFKQFGCLCTGIVDYDMAKAVLGGVLGSAFYYRVRQENNEDEREEGSEEERK